MKKIAWEKNKANDDNDIVIETMVGELCGDFWNAKAILMPAVKSVAILSEKNNNDFVERTKVEVSTHTN